MAIMIVVLTKSESEADYRDFKKDIAAYSRCQVSDSTWIIDTNLEMQVVKEELSRHLLRDESLLIAEMNPKWIFYQGGRSEEWIGSVKRRWSLREKTSLLNLFGKRTSV